MSTWCFNAVHLRPIVRRSWRPALHVERRTIDVWRHRRLARDVRSTVSTQCCCLGSSHVRPANGSGKQQTLTQSGVFSACLRGSGCRFQVDDCVRRRFDDMFAASPHWLTLVVCQIDLSVVHLNVDRAAAAAVWWSQVDVGGLRTSSSSWR